jgi:hypothetical protein
VERHHRARRHAAADRRQAQRRSQQIARRSDFIKAELDKWAPIIKASGAQVE